MMNSRSRWYWPWNGRKPHRVKGRVVQSGVNYPGKTVFCPASLIPFKGCDMFVPWSDDAVSHLAANHVYERGVCGHVGKENPGAVIGVTDDGYRL